MKDLVFVLLCIIWIIHLLFLPNSTNWNHAELVKQLVEGHHSDGNQAKKKYD